MKSFKEWITKYFVVLAILASALMVGCSKEGDELDTEGGTTGDEEESVSEAVKWIDEKLSKYYLYNEEYNTMERDLTLSADNFLDKTLLSMKSNVLDKKYYTELLGLPFYDYLLYSYVQRSESTKSRAVLGRTAVGYGFVATELVTYKDERAIAIHGVYKESPMAEVGLSRGDVIVAIDGQTISSGTYIDSIVSMLLHPNEGDQITITINSGESYTLTATTFEENPVLHCEVIDRRVGYLVYSLFNANFDVELEQALDKLIAAGATDLILDLRLNRGGFVSSANRLSSIIGGESCSGKIFSYYRMNDDLTRNSSSTSASMGMLFDSSKSLFYESFDRVSSALSLSEPKIYCLVSETTASASEMVINSLRGVGFEVVLIGERTEGKNVGMVTLNNSFDGYEYDLLPITFENLNCKEEGGYQEGIEVDYEVDDLKGFLDYGAREPLVAKALSLIMGVDIVDSKGGASPSCDLRGVAGGVDSPAVGGSIIRIEE